MRSYSFILGLLAVSVFAFSSCETVQNQNREDILPIPPGGVNFHFYETFNHDGPEEPFIQLRVYTKDNYSCSRIISSHTLSDQTLSINVEGIEEPKGDCGGLSPAIGIIPLELNEVDYDLNFKYDGNTYNYTLEITESSIRILGEVNSFWTPSNFLLWRYPGNSFAYLCGVIPEKMDKCLNFNKMINDSLQVASLSFPEIGKKPYLGVNDFRNFASYYTYDQEATYLKAGEMLKAFVDSAIGDSNGNDILLSLRNWKNQEFKSGVTANQ